MKAVGFLAADPENEDREITVRGGFTAEPTARASTFEAAANGAVQSAPRSSAEFGTVDENGRALFTLNMGAYREQGAIVLARRGSAGDGGVPGESRLDPELDRFPRPGSHRLARLADRCCSTRRAGA